MKWQDFRVGIIGVYMRLFMMVKCIRLHAMLYRAAVRRIRHLQQGSWVAIGSLSQPVYCILYRFWYRAEVIPL